MSSKHLLTIESPWQLVKMEVSQNVIELLLHLWIHGLHMCDMLVRLKSSPSAARSQAQPSCTSPPPKPWSLHAQTFEMAKAGLDSSYLSPFLPEQDLDPPPTCIPPCRNR